MMQQTIAKSVTFTGIGLHTGEDVTIECLPALEDTGIRFCRIDLPTKPIIQVNAANIVSTQLCTSIGCLEGDWSIHTTEHFMAAISMSGIDNMLIQINAGELPVTDGSAKIFMELFAQAGVAAQNQPRKMTQIVEPIYVREKGATLVALPYDGFRISYTLSYDHPVVGTQYVDFEITKETFLEEIVLARTFGFERDVEAMHRQGLALGGSLENAVLIADEGTVNPLRYSNEFARHKVLDLIGDLAVNGRVQGHFIGIKSGHSLNAQLSKLICEK